MTDIRTIDIKKAVLSDNKGLADVLRERLKPSGTFLLDVMGSPGSGKTTLLIATIERLRERGIDSAVIEGDLESTVDSEKMDAAGVKAIQLRTGGSCHLDARMIEAALNELDLDAFDLVAIENIGNLICPAEFDTGANRRVMLLSVPEGHDKVYKYPPMFMVVDALVVTKTDYLAVSDFDLAALHAEAERLNPRIQIFEVSARTGEGLAEWCDWLAAAVKGTTKEAVEGAAE
ncbi:MAG: hydrogenase nickel incorporation protein HypB [Coriobacteriia bacterium]